MSRAMSKSSLAEAARDEVVDTHRRASAGDREAVTVLVERYQGLARSMAMRAHRGAADLDDLVQVANYGLLRAIERFDPDRGFEFSTFAYATISGELKRYRRKTSWTVHVPRQVQEHALRVAAASEGLHHSLGRQPTVRELAEAVGLDEGDVLEVLDVRDLQRPSSLDGDAEVGNAPREVASIDGGFESVDRNDLVRSLLDRLSPREREIVHLRFFEGLNQSEIASAVGVSQMHVSRILRTALARLRVLATFEPVAAP
jgi:RNA polymerase sigma-B factor